MRPIKGNGEFLIYIAINVVPVRVVCESLSHIVSLLLIMLHNSGRNIYNDIYIYIYSVKLMLLVVNLLFIIITPRRKFIIIVK